MREVVAPKYQNPKYRTHRTNGKPEVRRRGRSLRCVLNEKNSDGISHFAPAFFCFQQGSERTKIEGTEIACAVLFAGVTALVFYELHIANTLLLPVRIS